MPPSGDGVYYFSTYVLVQAGEFGQFDMRLNDAPHIRITTTTAPVIMLQDRAALLLTSLLVTSFSLVFHIYKQRRYLFKMTLISWNILRRIYCLLQETMLNWCVAAVMTLPWL